MVAERIKANGCSPSLRRDGFDFFGGLAETNHCHHHRLWTSVRVCRDLRGEARFNVVGDRPSYDSRRLFVTRFRRPLRNEFPSVRTRDRMVAVQEPASDHAFSYVWRPPRSETTHTLNRAKQL